MILYKRIVHTFLPKDEIEGAKATVISISKVLYLIILNKL